MRINKVIFRIISTLIFVSLFNAPVNAQSNPPRINMSVSSANVSIGSEIEFKIGVSATNSINAFDILLVHSPELLEFVGARTDHSIASIWQFFPLQDKILEQVQGKMASLRLVGGMTTPYSGENGEIISLIFKAKAKGNAELTVERADLALADGKGTLLSGGMGNLKIKILENDNNPVLIQNNAPAPKISDVVVSVDPSTQNSLIYVQTENDGGVKEMEMRSRNWFSWGEWQKSDLTASVPKNAWAVEIQALGFDNTLSKRVVYFWYEFALKLGEIIGGLLILWVVSRKLRRHYAK